MNRKALVLSLALCVAVASWLPKAESSEDDSCTRGDGKPGICMHFQKCSKIFDILRQRQRSQDDQTYVLHSRCPVHKRGFVCCEEEISPGVQLLMDQECGRFGSISLTIGGKEIGIMSRPWMALLKFKTSEDHESYECGGTLITNRYILTAAHCFQDSNKKLVSVRLGEHSIRNGTDCALNSRKQLICAPPAEDFGIERVFQHELYSEDKFQNDIALIKLSRDVEFKEHIQTICLPLNRTLHRRADELVNFRVTGWGKTEHTQFSDVPMEVFISRKNRSECATAFKREMKESQLCAGDPGRDSCNGDSGGPLMYLSKFKDLERFVQFGVVSYGSRYCGNGMPAVYTNVGSFIQWIADKITNN